MFCSSDFRSKKGGGDGSERLLRAFSNLVLETSKNKHCADSFTDLLYCSTVLMLKTLIFLSYKLYMLHILHLFKIRLKILKTYFFFLNVFEKDLLPKGLHISSVGVYYLCLTSAAYSINKILRAN